MNNLDYLNSISNNSNNNEAEVALESKNSNKRFIGIIVGILLLVLAAVILSFAFGSGTLGANSDDELSVTGGEEVEPAEGESSSFLMQYGLSEDDSSDADWEIIEYLDDYYVEGGFDSVKYDLDSVVLSAENNSLSFTFSSDRADVKFQATLSLDPNDNSMKDISISPVTAD